MLLDAIGIKQGDSGGGLFAREKRPDPVHPERMKDVICLAGALSGSPSRYPVPGSEGFHRDASYASGTSLAWATSEMQRLDAAPMAQR